MKARKLAKELPRTCPFSVGQVCLPLTSRYANMPGCKSDRERKREIRSVQHNQILLGKDDSTSYTGLSRAVIVLFVYSKQPSEEAF